MILGDKPLIFEVVLSHRSYTSKIGGGFHVVTKSGNEDLDNELIKFFKTVKNWKAGRKNKKKTVDSWYMWRLEIKNSYINILN